MGQKNLIIRVNLDEISNSEFFLYDPECYFIENTFLKIKNSNHFFK